MNQSQRISLSAACICPVDRYSKNVFEVACTDWYDDRGEFVMSRTMRRLACLVEVINLTTRGSRPRRVTGSWRINIVNDATGEIVGSHDFSAKCEADESSVTQRTDVILTADMVRPDTLYRVEFKAAGDGDIVLIHKLCLRDMPEPPARYFTTRSVWFERAGEEGVRLARVLSGHVIGNVFFELACQYGGDEPEMVMRAMLPNGRSMARMTRGRRSDDDHSVVTVCMPVMVEDWEYGPVYVQAECMGYPVAGCVIEVGDSEDEGCLDGTQADIIENYDVDKGREALRLREEAAEAAKRLADADSELAERQGVYAAALADLDALTGVGDIKQRVKACAAMALFSRRRVGMGLHPVDMPLHSIFAGPQGTGKTTVAGIMGRLLYGAGVLSRGHVVVRERANLLGQYYSSECENTLEAIKEAQGGILFIDEAYQLCHPEDPRDPGKFVIDTLMTALSDASRRDWMLILAGYEQPMRQLFDINPGLRSRIPEINEYHFRSYSVDQLIEIAHSYLRSRCFYLTPEADYRLCELIAADYASAGADFGNGRYVVNLIDTCILPSVALRTASLADPDLDMLSTVTGADIPLPGGCAA